MITRHPTLVALGLLFALTGEHAGGSGARQPLQIEPACGPGGGFNLLWPGKPGRSYFLQTSETMTHWVYLQTVSAGQGLTEEFWLDCDGPSLFARLRFTDTPTADPEHADFDLDGLPTMAELATYGTDPLEADTDKDGIADGAEVAASQNPLDPANGNPESIKDSDGDGIPDQLETLRGTSPLLADSDGDGVPDNADPFPLDPTRNTELLPNPSDATAPVIILDSPANAVPIP